MVSKKLPNDRLFKSVIGPKGTRYKVVKASTRASALGRNDRQVTKQTEISLWSSEGESDIRSYCIPPYSLEHRNNPTYS
jgi:hypothetical protein